MSQSYHLVRMAITAWNPIAAMKNPPMIGSESEKTAPRTAAMKTEMKTAANMSGPYAPDRLARNWRMV
jgi:hypothetical protein